MHEQQVTVFNVCAIFFPGVVSYCDAWARGYYDWWKRGYCACCKWLLWCMNEWLLWFVEEKNTVSVINVCAKKGVCRKVTNPYAVVPLLEAGGYCGFWWYFIRKIWSVDHIIIVMFIIECAMRGSAEMSQIYTQWSHFWRLVVTVDFDDISLENYGQLII